MAGERADDTDDPRFTGMTIGISRVPPPPGKGQRLDHDALSFHPERLLADQNEDAEDDDVLLDPGAWFVDAGDLLAQAYCVTLVHGLGAEETVARLAADTSASTMLSLDDLVEEAYEGSSADGAQLAGVVQLGEWSLVLEPNGFACTNQERMRPVSRSTTTVTMYTNVNSASQFSVFVDGAQLLTFDMLFPEERNGARPDQFVEDMRIAGFVLGAAEGTETADDQNGDLSGVRLVERLTGVRLTTGLLAGARYRTALLTSG